MSVGPGLNDLVLVISVTYSIVSVVSDWESYQHCRRPVRWWLLGTASFVLLFRSWDLLGTWATRRALRKLQETALDRRQPEHPDRHRGNFLLALRHDQATLRWMARLLRLLSGPAFAYWTSLGSAWLWESSRGGQRSCFPGEYDLWVAVVWLVWCAGHAFVYSAVFARALVLERRLRLAECDLRSVGGDEAQARWGDASRAVPYEQLFAPGSSARGLLAADLKALPCHEEGHDARLCGECPICLHDVQPGDGVRRLPGCGHAFHRACIDLWLLRSACCPLCKGRVGPPAVANRV